jgi:glutamate racemase
MADYQPIGVFDSGYGGLTILKEICRVMPEYDYLYLGDNARSPYGTRSFESVYRYTLESVQWLFNQGCHLVVLACNTASAKALRTMQQNDLPKIAPHKRVLGVIRPTTEVIGNFSRSGNIGILATPGTVTSESYLIEIEKFFPGIRVSQEACPMWVPLVENKEHDKAGADYFVQQHLNSILEKGGDDLDTLLLACTHYPLLLDKIRKFAPEGISIVSQGEIVAASLKDYLQRHPEMAAECTRAGRQAFYTTDSVSDFNDHASLFFGKTIAAQHVSF